MRSSLRLLAASSLLLLAVVPALASARPRYGGTLRVEMRAVVRTLDPQTDANAQVTPLLFDTLVTLDDSGRPQPSLAASWAAETNRRWWFTLRRGVTFADGTQLTAAIAADSLRAVNPDWNVRDAGNVVIVETDQPMPDLPARMALPQNAIVLRNNGTLSGTGPFTLADWRPGSRLVVSAREDGWHARPFVNAVEIRFGRSLREQAADLENGQADVIEMSPEEGPRAGSARRVVRSDPSVLYALRFSHTNQPTRDPRIRQALSLSIDREAIANFLLQRRGEAVAGLLPNWVSGYSFLFPTQRQVDRARQLRREVAGALPMTLVYHLGDPVARLIAERVALNAADAGLNVRPTPDTENIAVPDIALVERVLPSTDAAVAVDELSQTGELAMLYTPPQTDTPQEVYQATAAALSDYWAVPIAYAPVTFGLAPRVVNWRMSRAGAWRLDEVSLLPEAATP